MQRYEQRDVKSAGRRWLLWTILSVGFLGWSASYGNASESVKVGLLLPISGTAAEFGERMKQGVDLALEERGKATGKNDIEIVLRDTGDASLQRVRQLAQELVVRENVKYLAGLDTTPAVLAVADVVNQAKIPFVIFNSGTSGVTKKSPYFVRAGFTQWAISYPLGKRLGVDGKKRVVIIIHDFAPGYDAASSFSAGLTESGGAVLDTLKVPLGTSDPSSYLQRIQDVSPDAVFMFFKVGPFGVNFVRDYLGKGLRSRGIELFGTGELDETNLKAIGAGAVGIETSFVYGPDLKSAKNASFVTGLQNKYGSEFLPSPFNVQAYDGMQLVFRMIDTAGDRRAGADPIDSIRDFSWESPRGRVSIDPETREIVQRVYLRKVVDDGGRLVNRAFDDFGEIRPPVN
ncbi:branched-chain amino acid transport system substrate-binding protein [Bradyrhizobium macuxiense]|uniref:Branched-chain amino acid transport system substrate-binding protein n=1 Tax=Bradyrhizobium macuxiense TaxID=1755647 RepID=A0A560KX40_9BRAD|nr:ABC transporter substrate-binding protein [Bradyrhizobium macuxiense]TWB87808.1 branched-chain amino acid transport system substrate-binding protein [Bradyrhizobium macuxiense]